MHVSILVLANIYIFHICPAETVIYRIFYYINKSGNGRLTLRELKRGNLIAAIQHADEEEDINKVLRSVPFFSFFFFVWDIEVPGCLPVY